MKYIIPMIPPSINKFIGRDNKWKYYAEKKDWIANCFLFCSPKPIKPIEKAEIIITFFFKSKHRHDADNYQKFLLDGLVAAGIIVDDDFEHISVTCKGKYDKNEPRTEIEVIEI